MKKVKWGLGYTEGWRYVCTQQSRENERGVGLGYSGEVSSSFHRDYLIDGIFTMRQVHQLRDSFQLQAAALVEA